jgi:predicted DNA-binding protein with PD1-like motif
MRYASFDNEFIVRIERGEEVVETLTRFVREKGITAGVISGIGAVRETTLGYFDPETREYVNELFEDSCEVASLNGTAGRFDGEAVLHLHATLADRHHAAKAGHLFSATVSATVEARVIRLPGVLERKKDDFTGLNLLDLPESG